MKNFILDLLARAGLEFYTTKSLTREDQVREQAFEAMRVALVNEQGMTTEAFEYAVEQAQTIIEEQNS